MRITRVYEPQTLSTGAVLELSETNASHLGRVLRLPAGAEIAVFDGQGHECAARLMFEGRKALAQITALKEHNPESPLYTVLGQVISRGDKMDFTIQKAVELGISDDDYIAVTSGLQEGDTVAYLQEDHSTNLMDMMYGGGATVTAEPAPSGEMGGPGGEAGGGPQG